MTISDKLAFKQQVADYDNSDRHMFHVLFHRGMDLTNTTYAEVARECRTAIGTVSRWDNGHSAPVDIIRTRVLAYLASKVKD